MKRVVIVGAGFGGLRVARTLRGQGLDVWLVDRHNYHLFQPLLYQVATASLEQEAIAHPVRDIVRGWDGVRFRMAEVTGVDLAAWQLETNTGPIAYDYLVLAAGAATNFFGVQSIAERAFELKDLNDAVILRNRVLTAFERASLTVDEAERRALLTFVVVGGGPTGVEFAGALAELVQLIVERDYPTISHNDVRTLLVEMESDPLPPYPDRLRRYTRERLERMGVEVLTGTAVEAMTDGQVILNSGETLDSELLLWMAGVKAAPLAEALSVQAAQAGRIPVDGQLRLFEHPNVYVIGDMAYVEQGGEPLPQMAPAAMQMGEYAGRDILQRERGADHAPFTYQDKGTMAVIGRGAAVARVFGLRLAGFFAWLAWLTLHLFMLIDFRNRLVVLVNWAYDYLLFERKVRLITGDAGPEQTAQPRRDTINMVEVPEHDLVVE